MICPCCGEAVALVHVGRREKDSHDDPTVVGRCTLVASCSCGTWSGYGAIVAPDEARS